MRGRRRLVHASDVDARGRLVAVVGDAPAMRVVRLRSVDLAFAASGSSR